MRLRAYAKINLGLDILGKRSDGYHEVKMIMQTIQMYDLLEIKKKKTSGISLTSMCPMCLQMSGILHIKQLSC